MILTKHVSEDEFLAIITADLNPPPSKELMRGLKAFYFNLDLAEISIPSANAFAGLYHMFTLGWKLRNTYFNDPGLSNSMSAFFDKSASDRVVTQELIDNFGFDYSYSQEFINNLYNKMVIVYNNNRQKQSTGPFESISFVEVPQVNAAEIEF